MEKSWRIPRFWLAFFLVAIILLPAISGVAPLARAPGTAERVLRYPSGPPLTLDPSAAQDIGGVVAFLGAGLWYWIDPRERIGQIGQAN